MKMSMVVLWIVMVRGIIQMQRKIVSPPSGTDRRNDDTMPMNHAHVILAYWRARDAEFGAELLGEPAWEIRLAIIGYDTDSNGLTANDIAHHLNCSPSTLRRWLSILLDRDMLQRTSIEGEERYRLTERSRSGLRYIPV
jgi:DNA-binding MarR family transcriptional regulator